MEVRNIMPVPTCAGVNASSAVMTSAPTSSLVVRNLGCAFVGGQPGLGGSLLVFAAAAVVPFSAGFDGDFSAHPAQETMHTATLHRRRFCITQARQPLVGFQFEKHCEKLSEPQFDTLP